MTNQTDNTQSKDPSTLHEGVLEAMASLRPTSAHAISNLIAVLERTATSSASAAGGDQANGD